MSQLIVGIHAGYHDSGAVVFEDYTIKAAVQLERLTRVKGDAAEFPYRSIDEVLSIVGAKHDDVGAVAISRMYFPTAAFKAPWWWHVYRNNIRRKSVRGLATEIRVSRARSPEDAIDSRKVLEFVRLPKAQTIHFYDHHEAHALPALFYTDWDDALLVTADGAGDNVRYSHRYFKDGKLNVLYGGQETIHTRIPAGGMAQLYQAMTGALGFRENRHEGKITGLAAFGKPVLYDDIMSHFRIDERGLERNDFPRTKALFNYVHRIVKRGVSREDAAASVQKVVEDLMLASVARLLERHPSRKLGVAGGLFANVKLNQRLAENLPLDEIFIFPAMGDEGLPTGGVLAYLLQRDGLAHWLKQRHRLNDVYLGRDYDSQIDAALAAAPGVRQAAGSPAEEAARRIAAGQIGAIYAGRMEYGPRALGARSILASAHNRQTHNELNRRLDRTEFMPFAPIVLAERAEQIFEISAVNRYACRFMTITCKVREPWRERIPAIVHVDNTARPQIISREMNLLCYDIIAAHERLTGTPVLVNTSFNVHEEPIVNAPAECVRALVDDRIDFVVTHRALYSREKVGSTQTAAHRG